MKNKQIRVKLRKSFVNRHIPKSAFRIPKYRALQENAEELLFRRAFQRLAESASRNSIVTLSDQKGVWAWLDRLHQPSFGGLGADYSSLGAPESSAEASKNPRPHIPNTGRRQQPTSALLQRAAQTALSRLAVCTSSLLQMSLCQSLLLDFSTSRHSFYRSFCAQPQRLPSFFPLTTLIQS